MRNKIKPDDEILKAKDVAKLLKVSQSQIYRLTNNNDIPHRRPSGGHPRYIKSEILNWFNSKKAS